MAHLNTMYPAICDTRMNLLREWDDLVRQASGLLLNVDTEGLKWSSLQEEFQALKVAIEDAQRRSEDHIREHGCFYANEAKQAGAKTGREAEPPEAESTARKWIDSPVPFPHCG